MTKDEMWMVGGFLVFLTCIAILALRLIFLGG